MANLLTEVPYKRGVHTMSVNQRYLLHEPKLEAAFELTPGNASFGCLKVGSVARLKLKLVNVSNLPQRFTIKEPRSNGRAVSVVYTPGVAAPGITVPIEVEVCSSTPGELHEVVTVVTEREEISLPVDATILDDAAFEAQQSTQANGRSVLKLPRIIGNEPRDLSLSKIVPRRVDEKSMGTKRFTAPERDLGYTRPDFFAEPLSGDEME